MGALVWVLVGIALVALGVILAGAMRLRQLPRWSDPRPEEAKRAFEGRGLGIDELARRLGMGPHELRSFAPSYREARIPKRSGGTRRLLVPETTGRRRSSGGSSTASSRGCARTRRPWALSAGGRSSTTRSRTSAARSW